MPRVNLKNLLPMALFVYTVGLFGACAQQPKTASPQRADGHSGSLEHLRNLGHGVYSGGEPHGEPSFNELKQLGVRTIVSVDGATPDVGGAEAADLRYIHIPIGYGPMQDKQLALLQRIAVECDGPVYVHCHHGQHRGPAAAGVVLSARAMQDGRTSAQALQDAGYPRAYETLYVSLESYNPVACELPDVSSEELPPIARRDSLTQRMAEIDRINDHLKDCRDAGWQTPPDQPDVSPVHEALMLVEHFRESHRLDTSGKDDQFREWMTVSVAAAEGLHAALQRRDAAGASTHFKALNSSCKDCHDAYRGY